jgi:allantoin racemase
MRIRSENMPETEKKYRFCLIPPPRMPSQDKMLSQPKERRLSNYNSVKHLLADVDWELHAGALGPNGDWPVTSNEGFCLAAAANMPVIREVCESGKYNAIVMLGGADPGFTEAREIARKYNIPVTACAFAQMHTAALLGNKFSVIDISETHSMTYYNLVIRYQFTGRCSSIRNINYPLPRPGYPDDTSIHKEREKAVRGEQAEAVETAVTEAVAAIVNDGAEVITFGCSPTFWLQPFVARRLNEMGWEIPVLEGYSCAITMAKTMVDLGVSASGLAFPNDRPKMWRKRKVF